MLEPKKILTLFGNRTFIIALFLAVSLWLYASFNEVYNTNIEVPLRVILPDDRAIEKPLPEKVAIQVRGTGWNLFNSIFFNSSKQCVVNLSDQSIVDSIYTIGRTEILKGIVSLNEVDPTDLFEDNIKLETGRILEKRVPLIDLVELKTNDGFTKVGDPILKPDSVTIRGNQKIINKIDSWKTKRLKIEEVSKDYNTVVALDDSLSDLVTLDVKEIEYNIEVQQEADITFFDVPVKITGGNLTNIHNLEPKMLSVTIYGGIDEIVKIGKNEIEVTIDYSDIQNDKTGILQPNIKIPDKIKLKSVKPEYIYHYRIINKKDLSTLK